MKKGRYPLKLRVILAPLSVLFLLQACSGGDDCEPVSHSFTYCQDDILYWMDSCGDFEELLEACGCGCTEDHAACQSPCDCDEGLLDCGSGCIDPDSDVAHCGGCNQPCDENQTCENGQCAFGGDCPGVNLTSDGVLDLDIQAVRVSGQITLEGASLPNEALGRGQLAFIESLTGSRVLVELESSGAKSYDLTLAPGIYHVDYVGNPVLCTQSGTAFPCNTGRLLDSVNLRSDGVLDVDISMVRVTGQVTLKGQSLPAEDGDRGHMVFVLQGGGQAVVEAFGSTGAFNYEIPLLPGIYQLRLDSNEGLCHAEGTGQMPCIDGLLYDDLNLSNDGVLDVDIPTVRVQGQVFLEGQPLPDENLGRGQLAFVNVASGDALTVDLETRDPFNYEIVLLPGAYAVDYEGNPALCTEDLAQLPCNSGRLLSGLVLQNDGVLDVTIPVVHVSGQVSLKGAPLPSENAARGELVFSLAGGGLATTEPFGQSGAYSYDLTLLPGTYDLHFQGNPGLCVGNSPSQMPCNAGVLLSDLDLHNDGVLDVDIPAVSVSGLVTLAGGVLPNESQNRGELVFILGQSGVASKPFGNSGGFSYQMTLLPGIYDLSFNGNVAFCVEQTAAQMPCNTGVLFSELSLLNDGALDVDIPVVRVQGQVTLEGAVMPGESSDRGQLGFQLRDGSTISGRSFGTSGSVTYDLRLLPGNYLVVHQANEGLCTPNTEPQVPCTAQVLLGCGGK